MAPSHFMLVVNAANTAKDYAWISEQVKLAGEAAVVDSSSRYALIAIQGPAARDVLQQLTAVNLSDIRRYWFSYGEVASARVTISRTGYTGEDGYEIFVPPNMADRVWQSLIQAGQGEVIPCGLGARDTLRLEAAMRLYGNDIDETTTALEAGLGWTISWTKGDFIGRERLVGQKDRGIARTLVGFEMLERGIARQGYIVTSGGDEVGKVTSGTQTPFLKKAVGMAYVPVSLSALGTQIDIDIRGRATKAQVIELPFYKRQTR
jgi:aminomethyltransferase